jgi:ATP-dependent Zn protease
MRMSQPGPKSHAHPAAWPRWLLLASTAVILTLLALPQDSPQGIVLSYSRFLADVSTCAVRAVTIDPAGQVTSRLASGHQFTTTIPLALDDRGLAGQFAAHHVQVTATASTSFSLLSVLIGLLPLLLLGVLLFVLARSRRQAAGLGGISGPGSLTRAKTRVIDAERRPPGSLMWPASSR